MSIGQKGKADTIGVSEAVIGVSSCHCHCYCHRAAPRRAAPRRAVPLQLVTIGTVADVITDCVPHDRHVQYARIAIIYAL